MRIVQINTFPYKATGNIMLNIHKILTDAGHDSYVVWSRGRPSQNCHEIVMNDPWGVKIHGSYTRLTDKTGFASINATKKLIVQLRDLKPEIVHLHNLHGYYINLPILFDYIRKNNIKVVWTLHDCWSFTGHCAYFDMVGCDKWKTGCHDCSQKRTYPSSFLIDNSAWNWKTKKDLFTSLDITLVTPSKWLKSLVEKSFLKGYPVDVIYNGIDLNTFKPMKDSVYLKQLQNKYHFDSRPIVLGVASEWTERKGLKDFVMLSKQMLDFQFVVVGLTNKQLKTIPNNLKGITRTSDVQELVGLYSLAAIFLNPTYEDNFPTTNIEALACGTPIITYDTGGSPEAIISSDVGRTVKKISSFKSNISKVKETIEEMFKTNYTDYETILTLNKENFVCECCRNASKRFDKDCRMLEYLYLYERLL